MKKIRALQQFSHFHAGTFDQNEERAIPDDMAEALVGMQLAVYVDADADADAEVHTDADAGVKDKAAKK